MVTTARIAPPADLGDRLRQCVRTLTFDLVQTRELCIPQGHVGLPLNIEGPYREALESIDTEIDLFVQGLVADPSAQSGGPSVFISHIAEDAAVASALKALLIGSCGDDLRVFVASDYESIRSGADWHGDIVNALKGSAVVIVLVSSVAADRPWVNYEAGVGDGAGVQVVPVTCRQLSKGRLRPPLGRHHARSAEDAEDIAALLRDVAEYTGLETGRTDATDAIGRLIDTASEPATGFRFTRRSAQGYPRRSDGEDTPPHSQKRSALRGRAGR